MSRTRTINTICNKKRKDAKTYSDSDILDAIDEARRILNDSAKKVWPDDQYMRRVVESVVDEFEYCFRGVLGNG